MGLARLPAPFLLITDRSQAQRPLIKIIEAALLGGCRWVSLREKDVPHEKRLILIEQVLPRIRDFGATLLVHGDVDAAASADGVHLPAGASLKEARLRLGGKAIIGLSCHTLQEVKQAQDADYVTFGPIGATQSKPGYTPQFGMDVLREAAHVGPPVLALGGVEETNLGAIRESGVAGFAVMGGVMRSDDPEKWVKLLLATWQSFPERLPATEEAKVFDHV